MSIDDTNAHLIVQEPGGDKWVEVTVVIEAGQHGSSEVVIATAAGKFRVPIAVHKDRKHPLRCIPEGGE